jgi:hypothetical protein
MEDLVTLQIIVKDSPQTKNKNNKNLFKFLNLNYQEIIQSNYYIRLTLLNKQNYKSIPSNIKNTPALINLSNNHIEIGTYNIINYLITLCEGSPYDEVQQTSNEGHQTSNESQQRSNEVQHTSNLTNDSSVNDIHDFLLNEALTDDTLEEPIDLNRVKDKENKYKLKQEQQKSTNLKLKNSMMQTFRNNHQNKNGSIDNLPREEKKIYDNKELTPTIPISEYMSDDKDLEKFWQNMDETT